MDVQSVRYGIHGLLDGVHYLSRLTRQWLGARIIGQYVKLAKWQTEPKVSENFVYEYYHGLIYSIYAA